MAKYVGKNAVAQIVVTSNQIKKNCHYRKKETLAVIAKKVSVPRNIVNAMQTESSADKAVTVLVAKTVEFFYIFS
jgi:hypothetical protein